MLRSAERKAWQAIEKEPKHPWHNLAVEALEKERRFKAAKRFIKKQLKLTYGKVS